MMRLIRFLLLFAVALLPAAAAFAHETVRGSGHATTREYAVSGYRGIGIAVPAEVELVQGASEGLTLTADDNVLPLVKVAVERGILEVRFPNDVDVRPRTPIRIGVRAKRVESISLSGRVRLQSNRLAAPRLDLNLAGASSLTLPELAVPRLELHASGHSHAMLGGRSERLAMRIAGEGEINAVRLEAAEAKVGLAGAAQVGLGVHQRLAVSVTGSGAVRYFGDPQVTRSITGTARIERLGAAPP
jgi:hypothetical protein